MLKINWKRGNILPKDYDDFTQIFIAVKYPSGRKGVEVQYVGNLIYRKNDNLELVLKDDRIEAWAPFEVEYPEFKE